MENGGCEYSVIRDHVGMTDEDMIAWWWIFALYRMDEKTVKMLIRLGY